MSADICLICIGLCVMITQIQAVQGDDNSANVQTLLKRIEDLERRGEKTEERNEEQQTQIDRLTQRLQEEKMKHCHDHSMKQRQLDTEIQVAFYGKMTSTANITSQVIKFNTILTDIGSAYQHFTGRIVAPVSGIYVFSLTAMAHLDTDTHLGIYVNDQRKTYLKLNGPEHTYDTMSQTAVYYLHQFDNVSVQHHEGNKTIHGEYTAFTAFLLQQDYGNMGTTIIG